MRVKSGSDVLQDGWWVVRFDGMSRMAGGSLGSPHNLHVSRNRTSAA